MPRVLFFILICFFGTMLVYSQASTIDYGNNPQAGYYATINGINLYYEIYGSGEPLFLLHGNGGSISAFKYQIPFLEKYFKVIAVDSRLQGKSGGLPDSISYDLMASDFCALINYLQINSAYVLGWSDGGIAGLIMAMSCKDKIKRLAASGVNVVPDSSAVPYSDILWIKNFVEHSTTASKTEIALNKMLLFEPNISDEELGQILCPVLVMAGDRDIIKPEHTIKIFQSIPNASLCIFPDSNHDVLQQHPELFNDTVLRFFNK